VLPSVWELSLKHTAASCPKLEAHRACTGLLQADGFSGACPITVRFHGLEGGALPPQPHRDPVDRVPRCPLGQDDNLCTLVVLAALGRSPGRRLPQLWGCLATGLWRLGFLLSRRALVIWGSLVDRVKTTSPCLTMRRFLPRVSNEYGGAPNTAWGSSQRRSLPGRLTLMWSATPHLSFRRPTIGALTSTVETFLLNLPGRLATAKVSLVVSPNGIHFPEEKDKLLIRHGCPAGWSAACCGLPPQLPRSGGLAEASRCGGGRGKCVNPWLS